MADSKDRIKCGKIFMMCDNKLALICEFGCQQDFYTLDDFGGHIKKYHVVESKAEETINSDSDCEYIPPDINENTIENLSETLPNDIGCGSLPIEAEGSLLIERDWVPSSSDNDELSDDESIRSELIIRTERTQQWSDSDRFKQNIDAKLQDGTQSTSYSKQLRLRKAINYNDDIRAELYEDLSDLPYNLSSTPKENHKVSTKNRYKCNFCHKFLQSKQRRLDHENIHTGNRPYKCAYCSKTFPAKSSIDTHIKQVHTKDFRHVCSVCDKRFLFPKLLENHIKSYHLPETDLQRYFQC